jgi:S1-C subfamily serine protease
VLIGAVLPQSPAEFAGLKDADIITAIEDRPLKSRRELSEVIAERPAGDTLRLTIVRDGERQERRVTLGAREYAGAVIAPDPLAQALKTQVQTFVQKEIALHRQLLNSEKAEDIERLQRDLLALHDSTEYAAQQYNQVARQPQVNEAREQSALGVVTSDLTPQLAQYFHAAGGGVLVNHVYPDTPAEKAGIQAGDIIILANKAIIQRRLNLLHLLVNGAPSTLRVTVVRDKREMHFQIRLSESEK